MAGKHAAQMMQMDFLNRVISHQTLRRGECLMVYSDFLILRSCFVLLQNLVMGCEIGDLMHSVYYQMK